MTDKTIRVRVTSPLAAQEGEYASLPPSGSVWRIADRDDMTTKVVEFDLVSVDPHDVPLDARLTAFPLPPLTAVVG
jgi:hypothetical protein